LTPGSSSPSNYAIIPSPHKHTNPEALGRDLSVLKPWKQVPTFLHPTCRLDASHALDVNATPLPAIHAPDAYADKNWSPDEALTEIARGRLEGLGPVTQEALAASLGMEPARIAGALAALEVEGFAMRGRFTPAPRDAARDAAPQDEVDEWCERRLLARIHYYTVKRLRAEIEPVAARDFLRFLLSWQRLAPEARMEGPDALEGVVAQLQGFEAPAAAWESEILPGRLAGTSRLGSMTSASPDG
jgi:ATP-dependent helicase Lhr and Lhr-like helicase